MGFIHHQLTSFTSNKLEAGKKRRDIGQDLYESNPTPIKFETHTPWEETVHSIKEKNQLSTGYAQIQAF